MDICRIKRIDSTHFRESSLCVPREMAACATLVSGRLGHYLDTRSVNGTSEIGSPQDDHDIPHLHIRQ